MPVHRSVGPPPPHDPISRSEPEFVLAGRMLANGTLRSMEIGIGPDGEIVRLAKSISGARRHDVGEAVILPSATDLHVHFRDPGGPKDLENFESGTLQSALGGVGLVGDMPNTDPPVTDPDRLESKAARARGHLAVGAFLYAAASTPEGVRRLSRHAAAFKLYLSPTTGIRWVTPEPDLGTLLGAVAATGLALSVHAESPGRFAADPTHAPDNPAEWNRARPDRSELEAIERLLSVGPPGLRLHVAHVTLPGSVERVRAAGVSSEATPQHLLLSARSNGGSREKVNPPLRLEAERSGLWEAFRSGSIPILASDHAPHLLEEKDKPFYLAPSGMPGVETMLPLMLEQVHAGQLDLGTLVRAACDRPARWVGVPCGRIAPGHRANLVVVDFRRRQRVEARHLHAPCGWTAFEGRHAIFPIEHYRDGNPIVQGGEFVGDYRASLLRPEYAEGGPPSTRSA
ncbi:MAG: amidohydrolase family protein [Thermoplasmata archaeon]|nr:amidohydrolase family protein [Thermoplasmata archaeon]MCI4359222.1 amidohydrolase family protein [Thermoplasmata archaeon]